MILLHAWPLERRPWLRPLQLAGLHACTNAELSAASQSRHGTLPVLQVVQLGRDYDTLSVDLTAQVHERHPSSAKCTMPSPHAHRHLRHVTGISALRQYHDGQQEQQGSAGAASSDAVSVSTGSTDRSEQAAAPSATSSGKPSGGRLRVQVRAEAITSGVVPQPGQAPAADSRIPSLDIRVEGQRLHAPVIERLIELPMDIDTGRVGAVAGRAPQRCPARHPAAVMTCDCALLKIQPFMGNVCSAIDACSGDQLACPSAGLSEGAMLTMRLSYLQADGELRIYSHDAASWHFPEFYGRVNVRSAWPVL